MVSRAFSLLTSLVAAIVVFAGTGAQASSSQAVGITLHHDAAATERLPFYRSTTPIALNVHGVAPRVSAMSVTAHGPDGTAITAPLVRSGDTFTAALKLARPGTWTLALSQQLGSVSAALADVSLNVVAEDNADLIARLAYALSALSIVAGLTLLVRARGLPARLRA